jgi:hypothetical protein
MRRCNSSNCLVFRCLKPLCASLNCALRFYITSAAWAGRWETTCFASSGSSVSRGRPLFAGTITSPGGDELPEDTESLKSTIKLIIGDVVCALSCRGYKWVGGGCGEHGCTRTVSPLLGLNNRLFYCEAPTGIGARTRG